tara:strand:- start:7094 stop:9319 length:2226 start_codon:yes stop_codon:yes gene_type:complete
MVAMAVTLGLSMSVTAEEVATEVAKKDAEIEQIVVVGKRTTYSNNSAGAEQKQLQPAVGSVMGMVNNLPGISIEEGDAFGGDDWSSTVSMRGFSINLNDQQLGITIDGIPNGGSSYGGGARANRYLDSENTQFVDVSQGTADSASASLEALGGTLNFVSDNPLDEKGAMLGVTTGDYNARRTFMRFDTGEFAKDTYAYFSLSDTATNRWIGTGSNGYTERSHYEFKLVSEFDYVNITARLSHDDTFENNYNGLSLEQFSENDSWDRLTSNWSGNPDVDQNFAETWVTARKNTLGYVAIDWQLSDTLEINITPYYHKQTGVGGWAPPYQVTAVDENGNPTNKGGTETTFEYLDASGQPCYESCGGADQTRVMSVRHTNYWKSRYGATSKLNYEIDNHQITAALWVEQQDRDESRTWLKVIDASVYYDFDNNPYWTQYDKNFVTNTIKISLQDQIEWEDFTLNIGIAKYMVDLTRTDNFSGQSTATVNSDSDILPSIGFLYSLTSKLEVFGGYSENFAAIRDAVLESQGSVLDNIKPETAINTDLGLRYTGNDLAFSASVYNIKFDNRVTFIAPGAGGNIDFLNETDGAYINDGGIVSQGLEGSLSWTMSDNWQLYSSLTLNDSEYAESIDGSEEGNTVAGSIRDMAVLTLSYDDGLYRAGLSGKYTGMRFGNKANTDELDSYTVLDFYAGYYKSLEGGMFKDIDLSLIIGNITDTRYLGGGVESYYFIGAPRTATVNVTMSF